jgi:hypothetical protein
MGASIIRLFEGVLVGTTASVLTFATCIVLSFVILAVILGAPQYYGKRLDRYFMLLGTVLGLGIAFIIGGGPAVIVQAIVIVPTWLYVRRATKALDSF